MHYIQICAGFTGLCNQLFALINGIIDAKQNEYEEIVVGSFAPALNSMEQIPISQIVDLQKTSEKMGVQIKDGPDQNTPIINLWYATFNEMTFIHTLQNIQFRDIFYDLAQELFTTHIGGEFHVVHFRIEQDGIKHWANQNGMTEEMYTSCLYNHYRKAITENIPKGSQILALTFDINHLLLAELKQDYQIIALDTEQLLFEKVGFGGREVCAILDLLVGIKCTGTFIGCHNLIHQRGSTFSYTLWRLMDHAKRGVFLDLDDINRGLHVWYN